VVQRAACVRVVGDALWHMLLGLGGGWGCLCVPGCDGELAEMPGVLQCDALCCSVLQCVAVWGLTEMPVTINPLQSPTNAAPQTFPPVPANITRINESYYTCEWIGIYMYI